MAVSLLDVNVLVALAWPRHIAHARVGTWFRTQSRHGWATCPFTECALVRILSNPAFSADALSVGNARAVLEANVNLPRHEFWPADLSLSEALKRVGRLTGHNQTTDAYLVGLALHRRGRLATLDQRIANIGPPSAVEVIR